MIKYVTGDATEPQGPFGNKVIAHCCNNEGAWGSGFVMALSAKWRAPEAIYLQSFDECDPAPMGAVQFCPVFDVNLDGMLARVQGRMDEAWWVANIIGQQSTIRSVSHPIKYDAIWKGLQQVNEFCLEHNATLHMPRMGAGLAGGSWAVIAALVDECCPTLDVTVYDLPDNPIPVKP